MDLGQDSLMHRGHLFCQRCGQVLKESSSEAHPTKGNEEITKLKYKVKE